MADRKIIRYWETILLSILGGALSSFGCIWLFFRKCPINQLLENENAVSIANTFIVFTTFLVAVVAIGLTVYGVIISKHNAADNKELIRKSFSKHKDDLIEMLINDDDRTLIKKMIAAKELKDEMTAIISNIGQEIAQQKSEQDNETNQQTENISHISKYLGDVDEDK